MRKSLFSQAFSYIFISLLLVVALLSGIFFFSIRRSVAVWNVNRGQRLENLILPLITRTYNEQGRLHEVNVHHTLSPFLTSNVFAYIFSTDREPIYIYFNGGRIPLHDQNTLAKSLDRLSERERPLTAIIAGEEIIGYLAADTLGFTHDIANQRFLQSVFTFMTWGAGMAVFVAAAAAYVFSKILSQQARALVKGLQELSRGERDVDFPIPPAEEMRAIADSARTLQLRLQQEEQLRRQWADDIAHDLRTPVSALMVQLEGLAEGVLDPNIDRLSQLYQEIGRIDFLVRDLRELNRVESPEMRLKIERINLGPFLREFRSSLESQEMPEQRLSIECHVESCFGDRHYLSRAITNVLQNCVSHGEPEGPIEIMVSRNAGWVIFDISNPGSVDPQQIKDFFSRLYRHSHSRTEPGSGLGLPITRAIMRAHGGDAVMTQQGEKTHLVLTLPEHPSRQKPPQIDIQSRG